MSILNFTTKIDPKKTVGEIQELLGERGACSVSTRYEGGEPVGVYFALDVRGTMINFQLPSNWAGVLEVMKRDKKISRSACTTEQAKRTGWRIVKNWVQAQLAVIDSGQASMAEVFLPYALVSTGNTLYQQLENRPQALLDWKN